MAPRSRSYGGMYNYSQIMNDFYNYQPGADDTEGRMQKNAFQGNFLQSGLDANLSMMLGQFNAGLAQSNMNQAADLELRNSALLMGQEFNYGMQQMGADYKLNNQFSNNQYERDLGMVSAVGQQDRLSMGAQGVQDRLNAVTQGEQQRLIDAQKNQSQEKIAQGMYDKISAELRQIGRASCRERV